MMFFRRNAQKAVPANVTNPVPPTAQLSIDTNPKIVEDEHESIENDSSSTPTAMSPVEKKVTFSSDNDANLNTSTNEHLSNKHPGLMRLFDSSVCTTSIVISYLFSSKEPLVQQFLGRKLFDYSPEEMEFYLPQLINMYIYVPSITSVVHDYITDR